MRPRNGLLATKRFSAITRRNQSVSVMSGAPPGGSGTAEHTALPFAPMTVRLALTGTRSRNASSAGSQRRASSARTAGRAASRASVVSPASITAATLLAAFAARFATDASARSRSDS